MRDQLTGYITISSPGRLSRKKQNCSGHPLLGAHHACLLCSALGEFFHCPCPPAPTQQGCPTAPRYNIPQHTLVVNFPRAEAPCRSLSPGEMAQRVSLSRLVPDRELSKRDPQRGTSGCVLDRRWLVREYSEAGPLPVSKCQTKPKTPYLFFVYRSSPAI